MTATLIEGAFIATVDAVDTEYERGHLLIEGNRIAAVGEGSYPGDFEGARIDGEGRLVTPGLVNCHHHLYQWLTRGLAAEGTLFEWLTHLYPVWAGIDAELELSAARAGLAALARSGCSTTTDHHYIFPRDGGDLLAAEIDAARQIGLRFHPCRGSMDLGARDGGLPPDHVVEEIDAILAATEAAISRHHDTADDAMVRIAVAPCSPFSVSSRLMTEAAELARKHGVRLHTHLAETLDEEVFCLEQFGVRPVDYLDQLGWLGDDVWLAHCIHLSDTEIQRFGATGTGVAHCPSSNARLGAGIAPVVDLLQAGSPVGLGVDGSASNECAWLSTEMREALLFARLRGGPAALSARQALRLATTEGARCLGRERHVGSLQVGMLADIALWDMGTPERTGVEDPITALVFGPPSTVHDLFVNGVRVVSGSELLTADLHQVTQEALTSARSLAQRAGVPA